MLAIIAGRGALPGQVAAAQDVPPLICAYEGFTPEGLTPDITYRLETLGSLLVTLGERGVTDVCFAGGIDRPALDPSLLDAETAPLVPLFAEALQKGDDGALRVVVNLFEKTGFAVRGAHELVPELLARPGVLTEAWPDAALRADADIGAAHIADLGPSDIGQACIVKDGKVLGMEDAGGTDALIARAAEPGAILFKGPKPDQLRIVDLPTIGPATVRAAAQAGLRGIVVDADDVILLDRMICKGLADDAGLVIWARTGA